MKTLQEVVNDKLINVLGIYPTPGWSILPQLMMTVFNEEIPDNLPLNMYDRQEMEQEVQALLTYSDKAVRVMLGLHKEDREQELIQQLEQAKTEEQLREILIMDLLYQSMSENLDDFPNKLRFSPAEKSRGEAFH